MSNVIVSPSILSADFANLERDVHMVEDAGADWIHVDVMDGHFVPNITIGAPVVKALKRISGIPLDVHLMIDNPMKYIEDFADAGADILTFHYEAVKEEEIMPLIDKIKSLGVKAGIAVKPKTIPSDIDKYLPFVDLVLVMTVEPGFGAQKLLPETLQHVHTVRQMIRNAGAQIDLEVDGGIKAENIALAAKAGANVFVAGSAVFCAADKAAALQQLRAAAMQGAAQAE